MADFTEHVRKAHELHKALGETKFREAYGKHPSALVQDLGLGKMKKRTELGSDILQTFQFHPLTEAREKFLEKIREHYGKIVLDSAQLSRMAGVSKGSAPRILNILSARGVVRLVRLSGTRGWNMAVSEVWDPEAREWKKALVPPEVKRKHVQVKRF